MADHQAKAALFDALAEAAKVRRSSRVQVLAQQTVGGLLARHDHEVT